MNRQRWMITWSSATACGNELVEYPDHLLRSQVWRRWESAHPGCNVDRLESRGSQGGAALKVEFAE